MTKPAEKISMINSINNQQQAVVIDIDDTVLNLGDRRYALYKKHFPHAGDAEDVIRADVSLAFVGERTSSAATAFMRDFLDPIVLKDYPVSAIPGAVDAIRAIQESGPKVIFMTGRHESLRQQTLADLAAVGLNWDAGDLIMHSAVNSIDPSAESEFGVFKGHSVSNILRNLDIIAVIGDRPSDIIAAFENSVPAILFGSSPEVISKETLERYSHVGFQLCKTWAQVIFHITSLQIGERNLEQLRDSFASDYSSWLNNLNNLCLIDVTVASVISVLSSGALLQTSFHWLSRAAFVLPLLLALTALIFAIRGFTSKYTSGADSSREIVPLVKQAVSIFFDFGGPLEKARTGDAIHEYRSLREQSGARQAVAHREFFYRRYGTYNPKALLNLRMFEMRSANYVRAYAEHLSSQILIWAALLLVACVLLVAGFDPSLRSTVERTKPPTVASSANVAE